MLSNVNFDSLIIQMPKAFLNRTWSDDENAEHKGVHEREPAAALDEQEGVAKGEQAAPMMNIEGLTNVKHLML